MSDFLKFADFFFDDFFVDFVVLSKINESKKKLETLENRVNRVMNSLYALKGR